MKIDQIYVVRDIAPDGSRYISQILIRYKDKREKYFSLPPSNMKGSSENQKNAKQRMEEHLKRIVKHLDKDDYKKLVFVSDHDQSLREYVNHEIVLKKAANLKKNETAFQFVGGFATLASLLLIPGEELMSIFENIAATIGSANAIKINRKRGLLPKLEAEWIRKIRYYVSLSILGLNASMGIYNLSTNIDTFSNNYKLEKEKEDVLANRKIIIDELENPFESDTMFTSADAMTNVLMEAFELNPWMEEEDRKIASSLKQYFKENPYLNYQKLYDDFASFGIIDTNIKRGNISASCFDDYVVIYNKDNKSQTDYIKNLTHELVHRTGNLNHSMLNEGMTSLIVDEYVSDYKYRSAYYDEVLMTKIFCELVTPDKMLEAYSKDDMSIIKNELLKLNPNEDTYQQFIDLLDSYSKERSDYVEKGNLNLFYDEGYALEYQEKFAMMVMQYVYDANFDDAKTNRIIKYLKHIGMGTHFSIHDISYFHNNSQELSYENAYSSELTEDASYHY